VAAAVKAVVAKGAVAKAVAAAVVAVVGGDVVAAMALVAKADGRVATPNAVIVVLTRRAHQAKAARS
jgi:hypothetical protein